MDTGQEILKLLRVQAGHYQAMKQAVERQTAFIQAMDIGALSAGASEVRGLMRKIRNIEASLRPLKQSWTMLGIDRSPAEQREIETQIASIRSLIVEIQGVKGGNAGLVAASMERMRRQMAGLSSQSRALHAYHRKPAQQARFVDRSK